MFINELSGVIKHIESADGIYFLEINVDGDVFFSIQLNNSYKINDNVKIQFCESDISIAKTMCFHISTLNIQKAIVKNIENGKLLTRVELFYKNTIIRALITQKSLKKLNIQLNDEVYFLVKAIALDIAYE